MKRGLLDIVTIVSLLLAVAAGAIWVRSESVMDLVRVHRMDWDDQHTDIADSERYLICSRGRIVWVGPGEMRPTNHYLQRDFELHWQAGPPPPLPPGVRGDSPRGGVWIGWFLLSAAALPVGRVAVWAWRMRARRGGKVERRVRVRRASLLRVFAASAWSAFGAALFIAVFWVRSYPYFERVDWKLWSKAAGVQVNSSMGSLMVAWTNAGPNRMIARQDFAFIRTCEPPTRGPLYQAAGLVGPYAQAAGFTLGSDGSTAWASNVVIVPYWFIEIVLLGVGGLAWRYARRQRKRADGNLCARCGYDLRATPERCPECGLEVSHGVSSLTTM